MWRKAITAEPYVPNLKTLREKIDQGTTLLASLNTSGPMPRPPSPAGEAAGAGLLFTIPNLLVGYFGWGTWWRGRR